jgi:predicted nuclease of predicted toxin-antitoxin system
VRFLIDNALSYRVAVGLSKHGHDAIHVRELGIQQASDLIIFERAVLEDRIIVSADTDFGGLLAARDTNRPSVILFRRSLGRDPSKQVQLIIANIEALRDALASGSVVVFEDSRIRIRALPIRQ